MSSKTVFIILGTPSQFKHYIIFEDINNAVKNNHDNTLRFSLVTLGDVMWPGLQSTVQ